MKKCKYLRDEKCVDCGLCEPVIELNGEQAESFVNAIERAEEWYKKNIKQSEVLL
jgi:hypothetical protein